MLLLKIGGQFHEILEVVLNPTARIGWMKGRACSRVDRFFRSKTGGSGLTPRRLAGHATPFVLSGRFGRERGTNGTPFTRPIRFGRPP